MKFYATIAIMFSAILLMGYDISDFVVKRIKEKQPLHLVSNEVWLYDTEHDADIDVFIDKQFIILFNQDTVLCNEVLRRIHSDSEIKLIIAEPLQMVSIQKTSLHVKISDVYHRIEIAGQVTH